MKAILQCLGKKHEAKSHRKDNHRIINIPQATRNEKHSKTTKISLK